uniref:CD5 antigen-like n=1 Tax=Myxine glutinosa TaxID=7769 RepID=UPI00358E836C
MPSFEPRGSKCVADTTDALYPIPYLLTTVSEDTTLHRTTTRTTHADTTSITTPPLTPFPEGMYVRLVGGSGLCEGRVEVYMEVYGSWSTVCDDYWSITNAHVVCRQLGCGSARSVPCCAAFGQGTGYIFMNSVQCTGSEHDLSDCSPLGLSSHYCGHSEDASVICQDAPWTTTTSPTTSTPEDATSSTTTATTTSIPDATTLRLVGGSHHCEGRVEILYNGTWGTVCDDLWSFNDAQVACRQLGCGAVIASPHRARFGQGNGPIWMDNMLCSGNETNLSHCQHSGWENHNCHHNEDASVICQGVLETTTAAPSSSQLPVRLVGGEDRCEGRVEVFYQGSWGTVCDDSWDNNDAQVVCRQLDCGSPMTAASPVDFGQGRGSIWMDNVFCNGSETHLSQCRHNGWGTHNCVHDEDATVLCDGQDENIALSCHKDHMEISIRGAYVDHLGYTGYNIHLNDQSCVGQRLGRNLHLQTPLNSCGTTSENNGHEVVHKNIVWARKEHKIIRLPVHCVSDGQGVMNAVLGLLTEHPSPNMMKYMLGRN